MMRQMLAVAVSAACLGVGSAHAAPFNSFDPRSMAMGGAGTAVGNTATAPFFNPSLLSTTDHDDDFAMELPIIGARLYDPDDFIDSVDEFQDNPALVDPNDDLVINASVDIAKNAFDAINDLPPGATQAQIQTAAANARDALGSVSGDTRTLSTGFSTLSDRALNLELGVGTVIGIPSRKFGGALVFNSWNVGSAIVKYEDAGLLTGLADDADAYAAYLDGVASCGSDAACQAAISNDPNLQYIDRNTVGDLELAFDPDRDIKSTVELRAISLNEVGLSLSREFNIGGSKFALGVTPKYVRAITLNYKASVNDADDDDFDADDYTNDTTNFNMDIGVAKDFENGWRAGMVVKNIIGQTYDLMRKNTATGVKEKTGEIELKPQARAGVSYQNSWFTAGLDVDLTENDPIGFEDETRYAAFGMELNALDWAQLRLGYRADMVNSDRSVASAGLGLSPFGVHIDLAVAASDDELGAAAQFGLRF
ncbi:MAG: conjugal transfer protein TraF [Gammaproteobacteria bacterium]|nr:conjugal transfer protein TraF [Gammaproteobacteria bacterium]